MGLLTPTANKSVTKVHSSKLLTTRSNISFNFNYLTLLFQPVSVYLLSTSNYWNIITCMYTYFCTKKKGNQLFFFWVPPVTDLGWHWCRGAPSQRPRGQPAATVQTTAAASPSLVPSTETNTQPLYSSLQCPRLFISEIHMRVGMKSGLKSKQFREDCTIRTYKNWAFELLLHHSWLSINPIKKNVSIMISFFTSISSRKDD